MLRAPNRLLPPLERILRLAVAGMVLSAFAALALSPSREEGIVFIGLALILLEPLGARMDRHVPLYRQLSKMLPVLCLLYIPFGLTHFYLIEVVLRVVIFIQAYCMLHQKKPRDYYYIALMAFFLFLAACLEDPSAAIGWVFLLFLVSSAWTFFALRLLLETSPRDVVSDTILLPLQEDAPDFRQQSASPSGRGLFAAGALVSTGIVLTSAMAFFLIPRVEAGFLGQRDSDSNEAQTGLEETTDLLDDQSIILDHSPVMEVRFPDAPGGRVEDPGTLYWRVCTYGMCYFGEWTTARLRDHFEPGTKVTGSTRVKSGVVLKRVGDPEKRTIRQEITLFEKPTLGLPCLDLVQEVKMPADNVARFLRWGKENDFSVTISPGEVTDLRYEAISELRTNPVGTLTQSVSDYESLVTGRDKMMLLYHELLPESVQIANDLTRDHESIYDKSQAVLNWLNGPDFVYSLTIPDYPEDASVVDEFILRSRLGHCSFFASAMTLMLRSQGVVARIVGGYSGGEWDDKSQSYIVRRSMAHSWVEVLIPGEGWHRFDPTPPSNDLGRSSVRTVWSALSLRLRSLWHSNVTRPNGGRRWSRLKSVSTGLLGSMAAVFGNRSATGGGALRWDLFLAVLFLVMLFGLAMLVLRRRAWRGGKETWFYQPNSSQQRATKLYRRFLRILRRRGMDPRGRSAGEIFSALKDDEWQGVESVASFLRAYEKTRFGLEDLSKDEAARWGKTISKIRPPSA
jgi:protein-glutamine gamma-glutamyltransferase